MPDSSVTAWSAAITGVFAVAFVALAAFVVFRQWRATRRTQDAAQALLDVHRMRLEQSIDVVAKQAEVVGARGADLTRSIDDLRTDIAHLSWLAGRIPAARDSLRDTLLDIVLPTPPKETRRERD